MRFADAKVVTKYHTFWVAGRGGGRTFKNDVGLSLFCCITEGQPSLAVGQDFLVSGFFGGRGGLEK
jgi:hypothetical protein